MADMQMETVLLQGWEKRVRRIERCRICGNPSFEPVIDLGVQALASLFDDGRAHNRLDAPIPLDVVRCSSRGNPNACGFVQLRHTVPPELMFRDYGYRSGINTTMRTHLQNLAREIESKIHLGPGDILLDIGANDGTLLSAYRSAGVHRVGFEPSDVRPTGPGHNIQYIPTFFQVGEFRKALPGKRARVVTSIAMFYDVDDPMEFCRDVARILAADGLWVIEMGYWGDVLDNAGFDSICHEHLGYYTLSSLRWLCEWTGFEFFDVSFNSSNGGSVRAYLVRRGSPRPIPPENRARIESALWKERRYTASRRHEEFRAKAGAVRAGLRGILEEARRAGKSVYGYGASTKGNVLLQYCGIGPAEIRAIADRNPAKRGRWTPGSRIPICSEEEMRAARPDLLLILPWHFTSEFLEREGALRASGTRFIVPFPEPRIL